jgi:hypothetical protein
MGRSQGLNRTDEAESHSVPTHTQLTQGAFLRIMAAVNSRRMRGLGRGVFNG